MGCMWSNNKHTGQLVSVPSCDSALRKGEPSWDTASPHCTNIGPGEIFINESSLDQSSVSLPHGSIVISIADFRGFGQDHRECAITTDGRNKKRNNPLQFCTSIIDYSANPNKILHEVLKEWIWNMKSFNPVSMPITYSDIFWTSYGKTIVSEVFGYM